MTYVTRLEFRSAAAMNQAFLLLTFAHRSQGLTDAALAIWTNDRSTMVLA
jgi:hypothetical protein